MMHRRSFLIGCCVLAALVLSACNSGLHSASAPNRPLYTASPTILPGEDIGLRLVNQTDVSMRYNLCRAQLQRRRGGTWQTVSRRQASSCPDVRFRLAPTETAAYDLSTPLSLAPGEYRVVATVTVEGDGPPRTLRTAPFEVTDGG